MFVKLFLSSFKKPKGHPRKLKIVDGEGIAYPTHHVNHQVLKMIKDGSHGRPDIYMWYCYNPVYVNGEFEENAEILKDEKMIPFRLTSNILLDSSYKILEVSVKGIIFSSFRISVFSLNSPLT